MDLPNILLISAGFSIGATVIGEIVEEHQGLVVMKTRLGSLRIVDMLVGELLPRIC